MATVFKRKDANGQDLEYYYCAYFTADGRRAYKSTGERGRQAAIEQAVAWEKEEKRAKKANRALQPEIAEIITKAGRDANKGRLTLDKARAYIESIYRIGNEDAYPTHTVAEWLNKWAIEKKPHVGHKTMLRLENSVKHVISALGSSAKKQLELLTTDDVREVQRVLAKQHGVRASTTNLKVQDFKSAISDAHAQGLIERNVGKPVRALPQQDSEIRAPFKPLEIELLMAEGSQDWSGAILVAAHTGLRLSNITNLDWRDVDLKNGRFTVKPVKQRQGKAKVVLIPMSASVVDYFSGREDNDRKRGPVFKSLAGRAAGTTSTLFSRLMAKAGVPKEIELPGGDKATRSFHSLRHSYVSWMANSDVPEDVRKTLSAHKSSDVHALYSHIDVETMRSAIDTLPGFQAGTSRGA